MGDATRQTQRDPGLKQSTPAMTSGPVADQQSGLETWSYITNAQRDQDSVDGYMPLILAITGALGVTPFAVLRFLNGEWIVGVIDVGIVVGFVTLGLHVMRTRRVRFASVALALLCTGGALLTVYVGGAQQVFWAYPVIMAIFYLLKPREAVVFAVALMLALLPVMIPDENSFRTTTVLITMCVMSSFAYAFSAITNRQRRLLIHMATRDDLTGAGNRRSLETRLDDIVAAHARNPAPSSLLLFDIDHFKGVNDRHGHAMGDEVLRRVAEIVRLRIRVTDSMYRIGGEEFVVLLEGQTLESGLHLAEQLRTLVEANELVSDPAVTVSVGVAELASGESASRWLERADTAMYEAKRLGRNRTTAAN